MRLAEHRFRVCEKRYHALRQEVEQSQNDYDEVEHGFFELRDHLMQMPPGTDFSILGLDELAFCVSDSDVSSLISSESSSP
jgi:hypothetical protein